MKLAKPSKATIDRLYARGKSTKEICTQFGICRKTLWLIAGPRSKGQKTIDEVWRLKGLGVRPAEIARILGLQIEYVYNLGTKAKKRAGIPVETKYKPRNIPLQN